jgi:tRNA-specific 2-thiouridylase
MKKKAVVAMSGGVDSSVAAALLVERGYDVTGIMLKLWRGEAANNNSGCCNLGAAEDARRVADALGIPFYVLNFAEHFEETVVRNFHGDYAAGRTPNPCVRCNQWVKFGALLERAETLGAEVLATGHYARVVGEPSGHFTLMRGLDPNKDQSYVLWMLSQRELAKTLFPVGEMHKTETRAIAEQLGLRTAAKPDSQEICFVRDGDLPAYVAEHIPAASVPGPLLDEAGRAVGEHAGVARYTVGQRKGLGVALGKPMFVTAIDAASNTVTIGGRGALDVTGLRGAETSFVSGAPPASRRVWVQHRAHGEVNPGTLTVRGGQTVEIAFDDPVRAIAPGQSAAFYSFDDPDELLGGAVISETTRATSAA